MNHTSAVSADDTTAALLIPGLSEEHSQAILDLLTHHPGSVIDLCLRAPGLSLRGPLSMDAALDDLLLP
jgi:hypothetical protein